MIGPRRAVALACAFVLVFAYVPAAPAVEGGVTHEAVVPVTYSSCLAGASGVAVQPGTGTVFVVDPVSKTIARFAADGTFETVFDDVVFLDPTDVAADAYGYIYVTDAERGYVTKLDASTGEVVATLGTGLVDAAGIDWFSSGGQRHIYVTDPGQDKVLRFDDSSDASTGFVFSAGGLQTPVEVEVELDSGGDGIYLWVADAGTGRVSCIRWDNALMTSWEPVANPGTITGVTQNGSREVLVSDSTGAVVRYSMGGVALGTLASGLSGPGRMDCDRGSDRAYVSESAAGRVRQVDMGGTTQVVYGGGPGTADGRFDSPQRIECDPAGNLYVADTNNHRIQKFSADGTHLATWGEHGSGDRQFDTPTGIALDAAGNIYVADTLNHRIVKLGPDGSQLAAWGGYGSGVGQFNHPSGVAVAPDGSVYVSDRWNWRIVKLSPAGAWLDAWPGITWPGDVAVGPDGHVFVYTNETIAEYDATGAKVATLSGFWLPCGLDVSPSKTLYIADQYTKGAKLLRGQAGTIASFGYAGGGPGAFVEPSDIAFGPFGSIWVADARLHRVQRFFLQDTTPPVSTGAGVREWSTYGPQLFELWPPSDPYAGWVETRMSINGGPVSVVDSAGASWRPTVYKTYTVSDEGTTTFEWSTVDAHGNREATQTAQLRLDWTRPTIQATVTPPVTSAYVNHDCTITVNAADAVSGVKDIYLGAGGTTYTGPISCSAEGAYAYSFIAQDRAGNWSDYAQVVLRIDKTAPTMTFYGPPQPENPYHLSFYGVDAESYVAETYWRLDGGPWQSGSYTQVTQPGPHDVDAYCIDAAGNQSSVETTSFTVPTDTDPPDGDQFQIEGGAAWTNKDVVDVSTNVVGATEMRFDGGAGWTDWRDFSADATVAVPGTGEVTVYAQYRDGGNNVIDLSDTIGIDREPPTVSSNVRDMEVWDAPADLYFVGDDNGGSGVLAVWYVLDGGTPAQAPTTSPLLVGPGVHTIEWWAVDAAGNVGVHESDTFTVNKTATTLAIKTSASTVTYPNAATITATLKAVTGPALAGKTVQFQYRTGSSWVNLGTARVTNSLGQASVSHAPSGATKYRAVFAGDATYLAKTSAEVGVAVKPTLSTPSMSSTVYRNKSFGLYSLLRPYHPAGTSTVYFKFYRWNGKSYVWVKNVRGTNSKYNTTTTKVSASTSLGVAGTYRVYAYHPADTQLALTSGYKQFTVK